MAVAIQFWSYGKWSKKHYTYQCSFNDVEVGNLAVVDARGDPAIVRIAELGVAADDDNIVYKQIRCILPALLPSKVEDNDTLAEQDMIRRIEEEEEALALEVIDPNG